MIIMIMAFTASRPGAIIEAACWKGSNEALRYRDIDLWVILTKNRHILVFKITCWVDEGPEKEEGTVSN